MNKLKKKAIVFLGIIIILLLIFSGKANAASASITSSQTVTQGSSVTVTGSVTAGAWNMTLSGNGQTKSLVGYTSTTSNSSASTSITFTASTVGTYTFTFTGDITDYDTDEITYPSKTCTITVVEDSSSSSSSSSSTSSTSSSSTSTSSSSSSSSSSTSAPVLTNLGITPNDFTGFKSYTTSYSVTVPNDCSSVTIYATAASGNTITGTGTVTLSEGTNKYTVTVSNSYGSTSYTLSIIRETLDGDDVANSIEGDETEETESEGIGLAGLSITGYELDPEFDISIYEYTVIVDSELTLDDLEEIKEKITAITNTDSVYTEITAEISDEGVATITIVVKDDEKEYATYVIYFEQEETEVVAVAGSTTSNESSWTFDIEDFTKKVYTLMGSMFLLVIISIWFAIKAYRNEKKLEAYIKENCYDDEFDEEATEDEIQEIDDISKNISELLKDDSKIPELSTVTSESKKDTDIKSEPIISETEVKLENENNIENMTETINDSREYKKPRRGFRSGGKH